MKLIIDIPEEQYNIIKSDFLYNTFSAEMKIWGLGAIRNGTPIPDNATNGDVIMAMFPNVDFVTDVFGGFNFPKWWWNSPYQKGGKE